MASDSSQVRRPVGVIGAPGTSARSTTRTLFAWLLLETRSSFFALEQRFVDVAVAVRFALDHVVADALPAEVLDVLLRVFEVRRERALFEEPALVLGAHRLQGARRLDLDLPRDVGQLRVDLADLRVLLEITLGQARLLALQLGQLLLGR